MDAYESLRTLPLMLVLDALMGERVWKGRKAGTEWYGACPIHGAKKNQTSFSFDDAGKFHCFSCGAKGRGAIDVVMAVKKVGFQDAVEILKGLDLSAPPKSMQPEEISGQEPSTAVTDNPPFKGSYEKFRVDSVWLRKRGFTDETIDEYEVFQYENPRRRSAYSGSVMLKLRRYSDGECVGYLSRNIGEITPERPKYRFPAGFQKSLELFGAWHLKKALSEAPVQLRLVCLVESPFSVLKFFQLGYPAVSPFGWSVSAEQAAILAHLAKGVIFLPDADKRAEATRYAGMLAQHLWTKMPELPSGVCDPEHLSAEQIHGLMISTTSS